MNGVNIQLFQFERDLTWMAFFMDAFDHFYARFGGRDDTGAESHLTKESLVRTMKQALELHRTANVQTSRYEPAPMPPRTPEEIPGMTATMVARKENRCIHCHDVKVVELKHRQGIGTFTRNMVFTYPAPSAVGIDLDADLQNKVRTVAPESPAQRAGIRAGDMVRSADGQRILTFADVARVLELTPSESRLPIEIERGNQTINSTLDLSGNWRRTPDPSWRESLHVAGPNGGFWGQKLSADDRTKRGLPTDRMGVLVTHIWGDHTRKAGIKTNDVVIKFDGLTHDTTINQLHAHLNMNRNYGDAIPMTVRRDGTDHELTLTLPKERPKGE
jgi:S1-C subfamily serine protease